MIAETEPNGGPKGPKPSGLKEKYIYIYIYILQFYIWAPSIKILGPPLQFYIDYSILL